MRPSTLQDVTRALGRYGERLAIHAFDPRGEERWSFSRLADGVRRLARGLVEAGVERGEPVALFAPNQPEWIMAALAVLEAGAAVVPIDAQARGETLRHFVTDSRARRAFTTRDRAGSLEGLRLDLLHVHLLDANPDDERGGQRLLARPPERSVTARSRAAIFYTAGTTGRPKGVPLTHGNCASNLGALLELDMVRPDDRVLLPLPLHHVYPFMVGMMAPLASGATLVLPAALTGPQMVRALREGRVTAIVGVPRLYEALLGAITARARRQGRLAWGLFTSAVALSSRARRHLGLRLGSRLLARVHAGLGPDVRLAASGGARLDPDLAWTLEGLGWDVATGYGLTETSPILTFNVPGQQRLETAGRPIDTVELRIAGSGAPARGEVQARGPGVFAGYHNLPGETAEAFTRDGWFRTGDLGWLDDQGYLHLAGRASELIVLPGGENVMPEDVERVYQEEPALREIGILERQGRLVAVIVPDLAEVQRRDGDAAVAVRQAVAAGSRRVPSYQRITEYALTREALPRTRLGKLRRHLLPALYERARAGEEARASRPAALEELSEDDRALLEEPAARRTWEWLVRRYPDRPLTPDASLRLDLGVDSLEWLGLSLELRERADVELTEEAIADIETVRDLLRHVASAGEASPGEGLEPLEQPEQALSDAQRRWLDPPGPWLDTLGRPGLALNRALARGLFRLQASGLEHLPPAGPFVVAPNHRSYLDPFMLAAALPSRLLARTWWGGATVRLFGNPLTRLFSRAFRVVPVDSRRAVRSSLAFAAAVLARGRVLVWFPEGRRSPTGELQAFRPGIGLLLEGRDIPVVPVFIAGTEHALPPGRAVPRLTPISVVFGRALDPRTLASQGEGPTPRDRIASALREAVARLGQGAAGAPGVHVV